MEIETINQQGKVQNFIMNNLAIWIKSNNGSVYYLCDTIYGEVKLTKKKNDIPQSELDRQQKRNALRLVRT